MKKEPALLFSLQWMHSYFNDGLNNGLYLVPSEETKIVCDRFGFKTVTNLNVSDCFAMRSQPAVDILKYLFETISIKSFRFFIGTLTQPFLSYTQLPSGTQCISYNSEECEEINGGLIKRLKPCFSDNNQAPFIGMVEIFISDLIDNANAGTSSRYLVQFEAVKTQWQYLVVIRNYKEVLQLSVDSNHNVNFSGPEKVELPNQLQALKFTSGLSKIPLNYTNPYRFKLVNTTVNSGRESIQTIVINGLPSPSVEQISFDESGNAISPMIVYI